MPGKSYFGTLPPLTKAEIALAAALRHDVEKLAGEIGERNRSNYSNLMAAANFIIEQFTKYGYKVNRQSYDISGQPYDNLEVEIKGTDRSDEIVIIGAHYDSIFGCPGANDNATGAAAVLELAKIFSGKKTARTLKFVEFVNEEPPFFMTANMGSVVYAKSCRERAENIVAMLSLETIGYYSDELGSQKFPIPFNTTYPLTGNYIAFIGNTTYSQLVCDVVESFRRHTKFPSEGAAAPTSIPGVQWSDHWAFWQQGYPALVVTDTHLFRYPNYHRWDDTPDKILYDHIARVVAGLARVIAELVGLNIAK